MRPKFALIILCCLTYLLISFGSHGITGLLVEGGIGGTGLSAGPIPALGSATVNGTTFDTTNTVFYFPSSADVS